jgi:hypothetical protein
MGNEELMAHLEGSALFRQQLLEEYRELFSSIKDESNKLKEVREVYGLRERSTFNFFAPLDKYWHESFHEIILLQILNPRTKEIGNIEYLHKFTGLLHALNENYRQDKFDKDVVVETQAGDKFGRIDMLIHDDRRAIIVESKINGAVDQNDQLARYYRYVTGVLKKEVTAIVYLRPVYEETKMPPLDDYSGEYKEEVIRIRELLIPVSVVSGNNQPDLCHGFLDICREIARTDTARIYIKQYSELLKTLGGNKMTLNIEKELFEKLFENTDSVQKTADIAEIRNKRRSILALLIHDKLIKEKDFVFQSKDEGCSYKAIANGLYLIFVYEPYYKPLGDHYSLGFSFDSIDSINQEIKKTLENILRGINLAKIGSGGDDVETIVSMLVRRVCLPVDKPANEIINDVLDVYAQLAEKVSSANITSVY